MSFHDQASILKRFVSIFSSLPLSMTRQRSLQIPCNVISHENITIASPGAPPHVDSDIDPGHQRKRNEAAWHVRIHKEGLLTTIV